MEPLGPRPGGAAAGAAGADLSGPPFVPAAAFEGALPGYVFGTGRQGTGYHRDRAAAAAGGADDEVDNPPEMLAADGLPAGVDRAPSATGYQWGSDYSHFCCCEKKYSIGLVLDQKTF